jgi:energy-coupling factor transporter ATP-binding protein EcfA2
MHITSVEIENIKSIQKLRWEVPAGQEAGWHVIIGDNGSGKTTFLRAVALALVGGADAMRLPENWETWPRFGKESGKIRVEPSYVQKWAFEEQPIHLEISEGEVIEENKREKVDGLFLADALSRKYLPFSCSFGSFRRFTGGSAIQYHSDIDRHLSLFQLNAVLGNSPDWLKDLKFKQLESRPEGEILDDIQAFINQEDFLPYGVRMREVNSDEILFTDAGGCKVSVFDLSEGYRSILSLTFELLRQLTLEYRRIEPNHNIFLKDKFIQVDEPGVVLIDEVDAHLHPTWQRKIGQWFRKYFPNMQFIVTTHSPLICQAAEVGTVFRLPRPGTDETGRMIVDDELNRLVYGNVLDAYGTELFGKDVTSSDASKAKRIRLAELNRKELRKGLTAKERKEQDELRTMLPTSAHTMNGGKG